MNIFKKIYCRIFQTCFKLILPLLPYKTPKHISGMSKVPACLKKHSCKSVLIITDAGIRKLGLLKELVSALMSADITYTVYDKTVPNPTTDNVKEALDLYYLHQCTGIICFGGGSSIDCAKAVGICAVHPTKTLSQMKGILKVRKKLPLLIAIPTTAGTGRYARKAVKLIFENLPIAYSDGSNINARENMLKASFYAGCAFTKSYVGYVHAVAHTLGGEYNVPHGLANAVLLPYVLEAYGEVIYNKLHELAIAAGISTPETPAEDAATAFINAIWQMQKDFAIGNKIAGINIRDIPRLAKLADKEANPLYPVPVLMGAKELEKFYYDVTV